MLGLTGLQPHEIRAQDDPIWNGQSVRCIEVGFPQSPSEPPKPSLVFIHGFGGSGVLFYEMMAPLSQHFHCYFIDIIGMGNSSRATYEVQGAEQSLDYFMSFIEDWR